MSYDKNTKVCNKCFVTKTTDLFWKCVSNADGLHGTCKECANAKDRLRRPAMTPEQRTTRDAQIAAWRDANPGVAVRYSKAWRERYPDKHEKNKRQQRGYALQRRRRVIAHYSNNKNRCACCGENHFEFLVIDHINGGGGKHRKEQKLTGGNRLANWLIQNDFPTGFRILCHNCNMSRGAYGYCPHEHPELTPEVVAPKRVKYDNQST